MKQILAGQTESTSADNGGSKPEFSFIIDVLNTCNLRCPSCPTGNWPEMRVPSRRMAPELLAKIMDKAQSEARVTSVCLYNWTEPILHPELPELIHIVQSHHIPCTLSGNLNHLKNIDAVMAAEPYQFHVSVSGFTQEIYGQTHRGGDIEEVKRNMRELVDARRRQKSKTYLKLIYHRYLNNEQDEILMRDFSEDLGFRFEPNWAIFMPLEKSMAYIDPKSTGVELSAEDREIIDRLALDLRQAFELSKKSRNMKCSLQDSQFVLDCEGNVTLCCGVYDRSKYTLGNFLSEPLNVIHQKKYKTKMCGDCMKMGGHVYLSHRSPEYDDIATRNRAVKLAQ